MSRVYGCLLEAQESVRPESSTRFRYHRPSFYSWLTYLPTALWALLPMRQLATITADLMPQRTRNRSVANLWGRLLKVDEATILPSSDFFDLGGHSLLLAKLSAALLKDMGAMVAIPAILERPTLAELAELLDEEMTGTTTSASRVEAQGGGGGGGGDGAASIILNTPALRYSTVFCVQRRYFCSSVWCVSLCGIVWYCVVLL